MPIVCKNCGGIGLAPDMVFCPYCGEKVDGMQSAKRVENISQIGNNQINNSIMMPNSSKKDLEIVKGTVLWSLHPGEIARRINVDEFDFLSDAKGVYVQDGVVAILMLDGKIQAKLTSGVYYFDTKIEGLGGAIRHVWRFFTGQRNNGSGSANILDSGRIGSELQNLGKKHIDVILVYEAAIPLVFGGAPTEDGYVFEPYTIKAGFTEIKVAVSMQCVISDIISFSRNYLTKNDSYRIVDLQIALHNPIKNTLQSVFAYEKVDTVILSPEIIEKAKEDISKKVESVFYGITVKQVVDITMENSDFARFQELERKLSLSKQELDYLIRTNDFKNRLTTEQNSQVVREARSEEELRYQLNLLNKDKLLHDDEMEAFCQLLTSQKKIREAKTEDELEAALLKIKGTKLLRDDDFADLEQEVKKHGIHRQEEIDILQYQSLLRTEKERISTMGNIRVLLAKSEKEGEQAEYEAAIQEQEHRNTIEENEGKQDVRMAGLEIQGKQIKDDYELGLQGKKHEQKHKEELDNLDIAQKAQELAINGERKLNEIERENKAQDYEQELALKKLDIELQKAKDEAFKGMSAQQIASLKLGELAPEAQKALAEALSSQDKLDWLKIETEERVKIIQGMADQTAALHKENSEKYERILGEVMKFASEQIKANANLVSNALAGQTAQAEKILSSTEKVYTHRINEVMQDKNEAKEGERRAEARLDHTQDVALAHTRGVTEAKVASEAIKNISKSPLVYELVPLQNMAVGLADLIALINAGTVTPDYELSVDGEIFQAMERKELEGALYEKYHAKCPNPNCGADGYKGMTCPECSTLIK